jgi:alkyl hydroperoxide reductase subunit AhpC
VNQGENSQQVRGFVEPLGFTFPMPLDERMDVSRQYLVRNLPTTFFIDRDGIIRHTQIGPLTEATLAQRLRSVYP